MADDKKNSNNEADEIGKNGKISKESGKKRQKKEPERKVFAHNVFVGDQIGKKMFFLDFVDFRHFVNS